MDADAGAPEQAPPAAPRRRRWVLALALVAGAPALALVGLALFGLTLPEEHVATRSVEVPLAPAGVWALVTDLERQTEWRPELTGVERLPEREGRAVWRERFGRHALELETVALERERRQVRRVVDGGGPFGGEWELLLEPSGAGSRVTLTERGRIRNPIFRAVARLLLGYDSTIALYLENLARRAAQGGPVPAAADRR